MSAKKHHHHDTEAMLKQEGTTYPRVTNLCSKDLRQKINRILKETAYQAIPDWDPGSSIIEATSSYQVTVNMNSVLSVKFQDYYFPQNAAHGVSKYTSVTLSLNNGHKYSFDELFKPGVDYQTRLNAIIEAQIVAEQIPMLEPFKGVTSDEDYYLTPDRLVIYYQPYVYTPGAYGVLEFFIPYQAIMDLIDPQGPISKLVM